jgi:hypothetical protein
MCLFHPLIPLLLGRLPRQFLKLLPRQCSDLRNQAGRSMMMVDGEVLFNREATLTLLLRLCRSLREPFPP